MVRLCSVEISMQYFNCFNGVRATGELKGNEGTKGLKELEHDIDIVDGIGLDIFRTSSCLLRNQDPRG